MLSKYIISQSFTANKNDQQNRFVDQLLDDIDKLKEHANGKEMKLQTLNFRFEKLQEDVTKKHEMITSLNNVLNEKNEMIETLKDKVLKLERENKLTKEDISPRLDALKTRYDVCMLEMVSMENDNNILTERIGVLTRENAELRRNNRKIKKESSDEKIKRLKLSRDFETMKKEVQELHDKLEDLKLEKEELEHINKRINNDKDSYFKKLEIVEKENTQLKIKNISTNNQPKSPRSNIRYTENKRREIDSKETVFLEFPKNLNNDFAKKLQDFEKKSK